MAQAEDAILQRVGIDFAGGEAVGFIPQTRGGEVQRVFEETVLRLKMLRGKIHPLGPDDLGEQLHPLFFANLIRQLER